ncbi:hypothetical protein [uncultured Methanocorpusculum sp.]|nr:hypothetical protein [uncultured Methanocorpusculum sp.]
MDKVLAKDPVLDYVTFAGSGEPTLSLSIGPVIRHLKKTYPKYKVAVLTNGSLLGDKEVREGLREADLVIPTLTSTSQETFEHIHRPFPGLLTSTIITNILEFRKEFAGEIWLEIFLIPEMNTSLEELKSLRDVIEKKSGPHAFS